ncbi:NADH-quinone oxidoreductase subunit K [Suttonella sp. R2A3]|uniref:NADH-quinone oxidoreductase subunit K n=1 Tax=Suttonella sp. R2A3 TaxID=2908648 RepID=UPI001F2081B2|nr:NADH-quinone oxidoreductase subunit K [Suttonella sp. R2A3]UJF24026.1 NADH-quinone oxidoreductase subunit K [Suttonella sp. R2A3]
MNGLILLAFWAVMAASVYLLLSREALRVVVGLMLAGNAVNLAILLAGRVTSQEPVIITEGTTQLSESAANALPQALILTAIVIGFALTYFAVVLMIELIRRLGSDDIDSWRSAEPGYADRSEPTPAYFEHYREESSARGGEHG